MTSNKRTPQVGNDVIVTKADEFGGVKAMTGDRGSITHANQDGSYRVSLGAYGVIALFPTNFRVTGQGFHC